MEPVARRLLGRTRDELVALALEEGLPAYAGKQLARWLYVRGATSFDQMTDLSKATRSRLEGRYEIGRSAPCDCFTSADGTKKYLFEASASKPGAPGCTTTTMATAAAATAARPAGASIIETVMIPDSDRRTLCVSSQAGCRMGCRFCMTGRGGFHGHLDAADILNQLLSTDEAPTLTNAVFMGMGEPLDNEEALFRTLEIMTAEWGFAWSPKRITVSTIGVIPSLKRFLDESRCHLAVSLHNPFPAERAELMPVERKWPLQDVVELIRRYDFTGQRRVSFEYTLFSGWNDTPRHAAALAGLLKGLECRINLIRFHRIPDFPYAPSGNGTMEQFQRHLQRSGITTTLRASRGEDVMAACGLLAGKHEPVKEAK